MQLKPWEYVRITERQFILMTLGYRRKEAEFDLRLRKLGWGLISSMSEQKITMQQWWPIEGDVQPKAVSQKWVDKTHSKIVAIWGNEFKEAK